ncbi:MAG: DUF2834 domain-containing protein [Proteobacteria bacterium]|nr:DUF2834 domain-containing protein [Pseudomonadota bacterium]
MPSQGVLIGFYVLVALAALLATWSQNLAYAGGGPLSALQVFVQETRANPASRSIAVDLGLFLLAASAFMVIEARRLGMRFVWLYILFGFLIAISVTFPLFMIARELRLAAAKSDATRPLSVSDLIGLAVTAAVIAALTAFVLH